MQWIIPIRQFFKNQKGVAKYNGCPIPDSDGDGVNDEEDKCPDTPGPASNNGCPVVKEEEKKRAECRARNRRVEFRPGY
jgi:hypothetical protein